MYIISACLLGQNCKYDGGNNRCQKIVEFYEQNKCISVCPERAGNLPCPRPPAEIRDGRVINDKGYDVTKQFVRGAELSLAAALKMAEIEGEEIEGAILKAKSPSCGSCEIYDGTFTHTVTEGDGIFVKMLRRKGIPVYTEDDVE